MYCKTIFFYVRHLEEHVIIYLNSERYSCYKISSFAKTMQHCVKKQKLNVIFDTSDHDVLEDLHCCACSDVNNVSVMISKRKYTSRDIKSCKKSQLALETLL